MDIKKRVEVIDNYAQKLINRKYSLKETRDMIVGGLKGYERLLSLSKDVENPRWKPLHVSGKWNAKNRRMAKLKTKNSWFEGSHEVELPGETEAGEGP